MLDSTPVLRPAGAGDVEHVRWALVTALAWDPQRQLPPPGMLLEHPQVARYHRGWGRGGDLGVIAEVAGEVVGVAFCRVFTAGDHGHGYVDEATPELAIAVREERRGAGLGTRLMDALADAARSTGYPRLSLSVDADNPARRLYERLGYREISLDEGGARMVFEL